MAWLRLSITVLTSAPATSRARFWPGFPSTRSGRLATAVTAKNAGKLCESTDQVRLITPPTRNSPSAKRSVRAIASVIFARFHLLATAEPDRDPPDRAGHL